MDTTIKSIGVREFREKFAQLLLSDEPLAVTKHGLTVGYYIPTHQPVSGADKARLREAAQRLHHLLDAKGIDPELLIQDMKALRKAERNVPD